jgi:hypothetical protein
MVIPLIIELDDAFRLELAVAVPEGWIWSDLEVVGVLGVVFVLMWGMLWRVIVFTMVFVLAGDDFASAAHFGFN